MLTSFVANIHFFIHGRISIQEGVFLIHRITIHIGNKRDIFLLVLEKKNNDKEEITFTVGRTSVFHYVKNANKYHSERIRENNIQCFKH